MAAPASAQVIAFPPHRVVRCWLGDRQVMMERHCVGCDHSPAFYDRATRAWWCEDCAGPTEDRAA